MGGGMGGGDAPVDPEGTGPAPSGAPVDPMDAIKAMCDKTADPGAAAGRRLLSSEDMVSLVQQAVMQNVRHSARLLMEDDEDVTEEDVTAMCKGDCIGKVMGGMKGTIKCIMPVMKDVMDMMKDIIPGAGSPDMTVPDMDDMDKEMKKMGDLGQLYCAKNSMGKHCGVAVNPEALIEELKGQDADNKCALIKNMGCCWGNFKKGMEILGDDEDDDEVVELKKILPAETVCAYKPKMCVEGGKKEEVGEIILNIPGLDFDKVNKLVGDKRGDMAKIKAAVLEDIAELAGKDFDMDQFEIKTLSKNADGNCEFVVVWKAKAEDKIADVAAKTKEILDTIKEEIKTKKFDKTTEAAVAADVILASEKLTMDASATATATEESGGEKVSVDVIEETNTASSAATLAPALVAACLVGVSLI